MCPGGAIGRGWRPSSRRERLHAFLPARLDGLYLDGLSCCPEMPAWRHARSQRWASTLFLQDARIMIGCITNLGTKDTPPSLGNHMRHLGQFCPGCVLDEGFQGAGGGRTYRSRRQVEVIRQGFEDEDDHLSGCIGSSRINLIIRKAPYAKDSTPSAPPPIRLAAIRLAARALGGQ